MQEDQGREEDCLSSQEEHLVEGRPLVEVESTYSEVGKHSGVAVYYVLGRLHLEHYAGLVEQPVVQDILGHVWLLKI